MALGQVFRFGTFELDARKKLLRQNGEPLALPSRQIDLLHFLVARAGQIVSKDALIEAAWSDVAVTDNSLTQAIWALRRALGQGPSTLYIETVDRRGYRFACDVVKVDRESDEALEALLAPHRAWIEGRAMLETLARDQILKARTVFEDVLRHVPDQASAHVGLANACAMLFETTRSDLQPDTTALARAVQHAREACRLDPSYGEGWATLGFVLAQSGNHRDARAASRRAVALEPGNWRHHLRLAAVGWGEERLQAAHRTLALLPGCPLAHWLAATVYVARDTLDEAMRELTAGLEAEQFAAGDRARFSSVGLHWLRGLILLAQDQAAAALAEFEEELLHEKDGHIYTREVCANTWYAIGAIRAREGRKDDACAAFQEATARVPRHLLALVATARLTGRDPRAFFEGRRPESEPSIKPIDLAIARGVDYALENRSADAAANLELALIDAPPGGAGWLLPVEPLIRARRADAVWAAVFARLRNRSA